MLRESFFESEERYLGDGFFPREAQWFELIEGEKYHDGIHGRILNFAFQVSLDTKQYRRSVYSILDFLGDVGGLLSILLPIGGVIVAILDYLFDQTLDDFIMKEVFPRKKQPKKSEQSGSVNISNQQNKLTLTNKESKE